MNKIDNKLETLKKIIAEMGEIIVAYSGGVDSAFLLKIAHDVLGNKAMGVLATSPTYPAREYKNAVRLASDIGVKLDIVDIDETRNPDFANNPVDRCYFCKSELFNTIAELAGSDKYKNMVDGSNYDDLGDHRPGMRALKERGVRSPLQEAKLSKDEIREISKQLGLPTWNKEAMACLSSRFPYGYKIDRKKLSQVDRAEEILIDRGFRNIRARHQENTLKIEVEPTQISKFFEDSMRTDILSEMKALGFTYVTVDLEGYRRGSLNETVTEGLEINATNLKVDL